MMPLEPGKPIDPSVMQARPLEWWLRPLSMQLRDGEQSAVVCMLLKRRPSAARASRFGVAIGLP